MKPRHLKIISHLYGRGLHFVGNQVQYCNTQRSCTNVILQSTGVIKVGKALVEMKKMGLVQWGRDSRLGFPEGWSLTPKGQKIGASIR